jgi:hypothetical protein
MLMSEKLLKEVKNELRKSNATLTKMLERIEEYIEFRKKQKK